MSVFSGVVNLDPAAGSPTTLATVSSDGRWRVAWSGRLDNRRAFTARFGLTPGVPDASLAAGALAAGGLSALGAAVGDFVLVAWDTIERRLWLARDAIGFRPLFFFRRGDEIFFSTEMRWLTTGAARGCRPNEAFIAETLAGSVVSIDETPVEGVRRLPPAQALGFAARTATPEHVELWRPPTTMPVRRSDDDLIEEFREQFLSAVKRSIGHDTDATQVSAQLSGGLDSTSVLAAATSILGAPPDAYSLVYPSMPHAVDGEMLDESAFIDIAIRATGARSVRYAPLGPGGLTRADFLRVLTVHGQLPDLPVTDALNFPLMTRAVDDGHTVMLTGLGGDYWLTGSLSRLATLLRRGRLVAAWQFFHDARHPDTIGATAAEVRAHLLARFAPAWAKSARRKWRPTRQWPAWLPDAFAERTQLAERLSRLSARAPHADDDVLQDSLLQWTLTGPLLARESVFRAASDAGIDVRHPMLDRDFVEFAMTLPDDLRLRGGEPRYILRRALSSLLPREIAARRSKGDATTLISAALSMALCGRTTIAGHAAAHGWIDAARLWPRVRDLAGGDFHTRRPAEGDDHLWAAVAVELWLEHAAHTPAPAGLVATAGA